MRAREIGDGDAVAALSGAMEPTNKQLKFLTILAERAGASFVYPKTKFEASREIAKLMKLQNDARPWAEKAVDAGANATRLFDDEVELISENESRMKWCHTADLPSYVED